MQINTFEFEVISSILKGPIPSVNNTHPYFTMLLIKRIFTRLCFMHCIFNDLKCLTCMIFFLSSAVYCSNRSSSQRVALVPGVPRLLLVLSLELSEEFRELFSP